MPLQLHDRFRLGLGWGLGPQNRALRLPCTLQSTVCALISAWAFLSLVGPKAFLLHLPIWLRSVLSPILIGDPYSPTLLAPASPPVLTPNTPTPLIATTSPWTPLILFALLYTLLLTTAHRAHSLAHADSTRLFPTQPARITREEAHANAREKAIRLFRMCSYLFFLATLCVVQQQWRAATRAADRDTRLFAARFSDPWRYERPLEKTMERDMRVLEEGIKSEIWYTKMAQDAGELFIARMRIGKQDMADLPLLTQDDALRIDQQDHAVQAVDDMTTRLVNNYVAAFLLRAFNENNLPFQPKPTNASATASNAPTKSAQLSAGLLASVWRSHFLMHWDRVWLALWLGDVLMIAALARLLGWSPRMLARELWWTTKAIVRDWTRGIAAGARVVVRGGRRIGSWVAGLRRPRGDASGSESDATT